MEKYTLVELLTAIQNLRDLESSIRRACLQRLKVEQDKETRAALRRVANRQTEALRVACKVCNDCLQEILKRAPKSAELVNEEAKNDI